MDMISFRKALLEAEPALQRWGSTVTDELRRIATTVAVTPQLISARVKNIDSAVGKLARKAYDDPLSQMTDLVGVRVVCLLSPDVSRLVDAVLAHPAWDATISRNTAEEVVEAPESFGYQSLHCELRNKEEIQLDGTRVPAGTCCELQVRTLMQHAYAEVVHDNIYKSTWGASSKARRFVSNSAALIEAADHLFCETMTILEEDSRIRGELLDGLTDLYERRIGQSSQKDQRFNLVVLDEFQNYQVDYVVRSIENLLTRKTTLVPKIRERLDTDSFWAQPVALFAYFLVNEDPDIARESWPFAESFAALEQVFSDLGESFHPLQ